jgi:hypothetical protein
MANYIENTNLQPSRFVPVSSRYTNSKVYYYTENKFLTFETYKKKEIPLSSNDKYYSVTAGDEFRPDLVSNRAYGTPDFWWRIMEVNNIKDIFDFKAGINIRIPSSILG